MSVPPIRPCSNISDEELLEKLKGKKFIGFTRNNSIKISLADFREVEPFLYTVVEFHKEGYVSVCYPALDKVFIPGGSYTVRGSIIIIGDANFGFVKNNGDAVNLAAPFSDNVYKLSDTFQTSSTVKSNKPVKSQLSKNATQKKRSNTRSNKSNNRR